MAWGRPPSSERPSIEQGGSASDARQLFVKNPKPEPCLVCCEPEPQIGLFFAAGRVVRLHAACEALWQQKRAIAT